MAPRARSKFGAHMFEPEVFQKQMYCVEESTCDIVGTFRRPHSDSTPGKCVPSLRPWPQYNPACVKTFKPCCMFFSLQKSELLRNPSPPQRCTCDPLEPGQLSSEGGTRPDREAFHRTKPWQRTKRTGSEFERNFAEGSLLAWRENASVVFWFYFVLQFS